MHQIFRLKMSFPSSFVTSIRNVDSLTKLMVSTDNECNSPPYSFPAGSAICSQFQVTRMGPGSLQNSALTSASRPITPDTSLTPGV